MKMGWIRRQSPEKIHPKNQSALERFAAASADADYFYLNNTVKIVINLK